uniref:Uncharacterized protein n=1 Tax=Pseudomonas phage HRDY3 TaxID=3236930 RepID=A0AB39CDD9_9VIRU
MLFSKIHADLKRALPHHHVRRVRGDGIMTFTFEPREGSRPIYYSATEYRGSVVLRNLNTGIAKSYRTQDKENLLCMLRTVQQRQLKNKSNGSGHGSVNTVRNFFSWHELFTTMVGPVKQVMRATGWVAASSVTKYT